MPSLSEAIGVDLAGLGYSPAEPPTKPSAPQPTYENQAPGLNPFLRCPMPPIWQSSPDSLRQFYQNNVIPQLRLFNPTNTNSGGSSTTGSATGGGTGPTPSPSPSPTPSTQITQVSLSTSVLAPGATFSGSASFSQAFQLLSLSSNNAARIEMYGTLLAQNSDAYRGLDVPPPAGSMQNLITDVALDTSPFTWAFQDRVGANGNSPQTSVIYITVTNLSAATTAINVTFTFLPLVTS